MEYVLAVIACWFLVYCFIFEPKAMQPSIMKTVTRGMHMNADEKRLFDCLRAMSELEYKLAPKKTPLP